MAIQTTGFGLVSQVLFGFYKLQHQGNQYTEETKSNGTQPTHHRKKRKTEHDAKGTLINNNEFSRICKFTFIQNEAKQNININMITKGEPETLIMQYRVGVGIDIYCDIRCQKRPPTYKPLLLHV